MKFVQTLWRGIQDASYPRGTERRKEESGFFSHMKEAGFPLWCEHILLTLKSNCPEVWQSYMQSLQMPRGFLAWDSPGIIPLLDRALLRTVWLKAVLNSSMLFDI